MFTRNLKTNHIKTPLGYAIDKPVFSWVAESDESKTQEWAKIEVSLYSDFESLLYDSGERSDISGLGFTPDITLKPRTRYYWRVTVKGDSGDCANEISWFETGKMDEPFLAKRITPDWDDVSVQPNMRTDFVLTADVKSARAYVSGLGLYRLEINGERVGNEYLTPGLFAYDLWMQYQTYDVTELVKPGENAVGAMLGDGWAKGRYGWDCKEKGFYADRHSFICELRVTLSDGQEVVIGTDDSWKCAAGPVLKTSIYDGETFDANLTQEGFSKPHFDDTAWSKCRIIENPFANLTERRSVPVVIKHVRKPIELIRTPIGEIVLDFGQNMTGWVRFSANTPQNAKLSLYYGEILQDGCFYNENLRTAKAEYHCISDGSAHIYEPLFTFYGFRYVKLEGWIEEPDMSSFEACVVYSDLDEIGHIETSSPKVNRLFENALWGQRGNFLDVPTDCPQRDERLGWTGDAQIFCGTASFNMDAYAFYAKYLHDLYQEQKICGFVPDFVPFSKDLQHKTVFHSQGSCAWGDAATIIPWVLYLHSGDASILETQFDSMRQWVDYVSDKGAVIGENDGWLKGFHYGDWLALDTPDPNGFKGGTEDYYLAAAYYAYSAGIVAKAAKVLGKSAEYDHYSVLAEKARCRIQNEYFSGSGRMVIHNQTAYVIALIMGLAKSEHQSKVVQELQKRIKENGGRLNTGFVGTPYLCRVLSDHGASDTAYSLFLSEDYPSWLYEVNMGATTIWERWNSVNPDGKISSTGMNSLNHYSYGAIVEWMYRNMCGINPCEAYPGFKKVIIQPEPNSNLTYAQMSLDSAMGLYEIKWQIEKNGSLTVNVRIPFNAEAELIVPFAITEQLNGADGLHTVQHADSVTIFLIAGEYSIRYMPTRSYLKHFGLETPIAVLLQSDDAKAVVMKYFPLAEQNMTMAQSMGISTFADMRDNAMISQYFQVDWNALANDLNSIM
jgi:alpha-L-rhamnosidase